MNHTLLYLYCILYDNSNITVLLQKTELLIFKIFVPVDWRVRPLMLFIKHWARFHDINDASKKTISSYSLSLMLIHYLQGRVILATMLILHMLNQLITKHYY